MALVEKKTIAVFRSLCIPVAALTLLLSPPAASAEQLLLLQTQPVERTSLPEAPRQPDSRLLDFCLDGNGDLAIRRGAVALVVAYSALDDVIEQQERSRSARLQRSGISFKVSLLF